MAMEGSNYTTLAALGFQPSVDDVWRDSEAAVRDLSKPGKYSVLLVRLWGFEEDAFQFDYLPVYEQVATDAGLQVRECTRPWRLGTEHLLFFVKDRHLTDEELLLAAS